jgi:CDGSH-type Zn-finger protein
MAGKGSRPRPFSVSQETYDKNWDSIFNKGKQMSTIEENQVPCGCGRSASGFCTGLHNLTEDEWQAKLESEFEDE